MTPLVNDRWRGVFVAAEISAVTFTRLPRGSIISSRGVAICGKKAEVGAHTDLDMQIGALLVDEASRRATGADAKKLAEWAKSLARQESQFAGQSSPTR